MGRHRYYSLIWLSIFIWWWRYLFAYWDWWSTTYSDKSCVLASIW